MEAPEAKAEREKLEKEALEKKVKEAKEKRKNTREIIITVPGGSVSATRDSVYHTVDLHQLLPMLENQARDDQHIQCK
ncbi:MAG: hypothetical protein U0176_05365 [Bacteroidia bacterium]